MEVFQRYVSAEEAWESYKKDVFQGNEELLEGFEGNSAEFQDYGLYTQVEQLNKTGMENHGMDSKGQLYKINSFEFFRYEDVIKKEDDPTYDQKAFEKLLEIKGDSDHTKLIQMLTDLNDTSQPIEDILDQYFDRENLTYWMAYQILTGNVDTQNRSRREL